MRGSFHVCIFFCSGSWPHRERLGISSGHGWGTWEASWQAVMSRASQSRPVRLSTNPYKSTSARLRLSVIAFVDVLGYGDLIRERRSRSENLDLLARLHEALRRSGRWLDGPASDKSTGEDDEKDSEPWSPSPTTSSSVGPSILGSCPRSNLIQSWTMWSLSSVLPSWALPDFNSKWRTPVSL